SIVENVLWCLTMYGQSGLNHSRTTTLPSLVSSASLYSLPSRSVRVKSGAGSPTAATFCVSFFLSFCACSGCAPARPTATTALAAAAANRPLSFNAFMRYSLLVVPCFIAWVPDDHPRPPSLASVPPFRSSDVRQSVPDGSSICQKRP